VKLRGGSNESIVWYATLLLDVRLAPDVDIALISASQLIGAGFEVILGTLPRLKDPSGTNMPLITTERRTGSTGREPWTA